MYTIQYSLNVLSQVGHQAQPGRRGQAVVLENLSMNTEAVCQFLSLEGIIVEERAQVKQASENALVVYSPCVIDLDIAMFIHLIAQNIDAAAYIYSAAVRK